MTRIITPERIAELKAHALHECRVLAGEIDMDIEHEAVRRGLFTPAQARLAFDGGPVPASLTRLVDFLFTLRGLYCAELMDGSFTPDESDTSDEDGLPW